MKKIVTITLSIVPAALAGILLLCISCRKLVEVPLPVNQPATATIFADDQTATSAINGVYSSMMIQILSLPNAGLSLYPALSSDELLNTSPDANISSFTNNALNGTNTVIEGQCWKKMYNLIYQANAILIGLDNTTALSASVKSQLTGEAKFVRAFCYFYLVNLFGDVPYVAGTDYTTNAVLPRTPVNEVYTNITADLLEATQLMSSEYPSEGRLRPNKWVAAALLARVYLYQQQWAEAESTAGEVINAGMYELASLDAVFAANSTEAIWQLLPILSYLNTADGFTFIPYAATVRPSFIASAWLLDAFENNDQRKTAWLHSNTVNGIAYYYPFKYKVRSGNVVTEYNTVFRLAEQYLIRAEARARLNNSSGAQEDLNTIRNRAGLANTTAGTEAALLLAIEQERRVEFFAEWGHRWFDLKRTQRTDEILGAEKTGWQSTDALYPVPVSELQANIYLTQNPGY
jgi:starch-binding outer membrane protein, SusD/RagB family